MKKIFCALLVVLLLAGLLAGCGGGSRQQYEIASSSAAAPYARPADMGMRAEMEMDMAMEAPMEENIVTGGSGFGGEGSAPVTQIAQDSRKIITTVNINMETKEFDAGVDSVTAIIEQFGGFVQNSYVEGKSLYDQRGVRTARFTLRVPADKLSDLLSAFGSTFNITSTDQSGDDITDSYYDTQAHLNSLKIQEEQLLRMLEQAAELQYLLEVQRELANVRYQIESLTSALSRMDSYVSMSTVNVHLQEVVEYEQLRNQPLSFGEEFAMTVRESMQMFADFCRGALLTLIMLLPYLLLLLVLLLFLLFLRRRSKRRRAKKLAKQQADFQLRTMMPHKLESAEQPPQSQEPEAQPPTDKKD